MPFRSGAVVIAALCLVPALGSAQDVRRVLVAPLDGDEVKTEVRDGLHALVVDEVRKLRNVEAVDLNTRAVQILGECRGDPSCLGKRLGRLGVNQFVLGTVTRPESGGFQLDLGLYETPEGGQLSTVTQVIKGKGIQLEAQARRAAVGLITPEDLTGTLMVEVSVRGADITVDGKRAGKSPLAGPIAGLREGRRKVKVTRAGHRDFEGTVDILFGEEASLDVRLLRDTKDEFTPHTDSDKPVAQRVAGGRGIPFPAVAVGVAGVLATALLVSFGLALTGAAVGLTVYLARALEVRARAGVLLFPGDLPLLWGWRLSFVSMVAASLVTVALLLLGSAGTLAGTGGLLGFHFTRPLPNTAAEDFGGVELKTVKRGSGPPRAPTKKPARAEPEDDVLAAPPDEPAPALPPRKAAPPPREPEPDVEPAPAPAPSPKKKPAKRKAAEQTEDNLPDGE